MKKLSVKTKTNEYEILIKSGILNEIFDFLPKNRKFFLISNDNLEKLYPDFINKFENKIIIKDGEKYKNFDTFRFVCEKLLEGRIERKDCILAFGGGVTGDITGYVSSSVLRGIDYFQIPTTLLAQVDSSVGGKTGINSKHGKNLIGAFYQPKAVFADLKVLNTLPKREIKTGLGEIVKYAFIEKNCSQNPSYYLFEYLKNMESFDFEEIVYKSCALKAEVVSKDEKEKGLRAVLNFGHTFAHAIETLTNYDTYTHGEAVAMGMKSAFELSLNLGFIDKNYYLEANNLIDKFNLANVYKIGADKNGFIKVMHSDKKVASSKIRLVLPTDRGCVKIFDDISEDEIKKVI